MDDRPSGAIDWLRGLFGGRKTQPPRWNGARALTSGRRAVLATETVACDAICRVAGGSGPRDQAASNAFGRPVDGFGFLVPRGEDPDLLGTLYCHDIFPGQAPSGSLFLRAMVGGARQPEAVKNEDDVLLKQVRSSLERVLGANPEPNRAWVIRWEHGIAQYTVGHLDRVAAAEAAAANAGIDLAGSPYRGVSVNDCIKQARAAATRLAGRLGR